MLAMTFPAGALQETLLIFLASRASRAHRSRLRMTYSKVRSFNNAGMRSLQDRSVGRHAGLKVSSPDFSLRWHAVRSGLRWCRTRARIPGWAVRSPSTTAAALVRSRSPKPGNRPSRSSISAPTVAPEASNSACPPAGPRRL